MEEEQEGLVGRGFRLSRTVADLGMKTHGNYGKHENYGSKAMTDGDRLPASG